MTGRERRRTSDRMAGRAARRPSAAESRSAGRAAVHRRPPNGRTPDEVRRRRRDRRRVMFPPTALVEPRPAAIVAIPVRADREPDDRQAERRAVGDGRHRRTLVRVVQRTAVYPPAGAGDDHVAPAIAGNASHHRHRGTPGYLGDDRIVRRRARIHVCRRVGDRLALRERGHRGPDASRGACQRDANELLSHRFSFWLESFCLTSCRIRHYGSR